MGNEKNLNQDSWPSGRDFGPGHPRYVGVLPT
jgi:hypothetical protein